MNDRIRHLRAYPWSSYRAYVGLAPAASWLCCQPVLAMMGERNARKQYAKFVETGIAETDDDFVKWVWGCGLGLGSETFQEKLKTLQVSAGERYGKEDRAFRRVKRGYEPTRILQEVARYYGREPGELKLRRKGDWAKPVAAELLIRHSGLTQKQAAKLLGLSTGAAVCMQMKRLRSKEGMEARIAVEEIERLF